MRLFVVIATVGRASLTASNVSRLLKQTRPPDGIVVCGASPEDVEGVSEVDGLVQVMLSRPGSCDQRNAALDKIVGDADIVTFLDDDFIPRDDYLERTQEIFCTKPDVVGVTGRLIADGAVGSGVELNLALEMIAQDGNASTAEKSMQALYGCNMSVRVSAVGSLRFDESLPLYAWLEDIDFSFQLGKVGKLLKSDRVGGVHLGIKRGRTSGKRFGYSQIANVLYLKKKGTMQAGLGEKLLFQNITSNLRKSFFPEPYIDRRGRLLGNALALIDLARGELDPQRIRSM